MGLDGSYITSTTPILSHVTSVCSSFLLIAFCELQTVMTWRPVHLRSWRGDTSGSTVWKSSFWPWKHHRQPRRGCYLKHHHVPVDILYWCCHRGTHHLSNLLYASLLQTGLMFQGAGLAAQAVRLGRAMCWHVIQDKSGLSKWQVFVHLL